MKLKMKLKSVSSLILLVGTLAYAAMQIGVSGPAAAIASAPAERTSPPQRIMRKDAPRQEKASPRHPQVYFATAQ
jgi:hypothetical protein